ncbi:hypothetical protein [Actinoplanes sp. NBRC 101535]|uniref:hypothetical protein n=1 Tax=Actinoplanes sp. NBRC 101535 TaxID=3032196 RepID=UPI00249FE2C4|nr:hypothetical protein [Actinoplanes sp. NBRC 101535]GLY03998.1 hypothetical protein Acsp01_43770 [Actinoplanes sp. NBRC 101535]
MKLKVFAAALTGMLAALCLQLPASAAPAWEEVFASGNHSDKTTGGVCQSSGGLEAFGCFESDGDWFVINDAAVDGYSAAIVWWNYSQNDPNELYRRGVCVEKRGEGYFGGCNQNFHEGTVVEIRVCRYSAGASGAVPDKVYNCNLAVGLRKMTTA